MANNISDYYDNPFLKYFKSSSSSGTTSGFKPVAGSTNANIAAIPLSDLEKQKADLKENEQSLGLLGIGQKALAGGRGFLSETLGFLSRPKSAIVGLGSGLLHQDDGNGDDTDDGAVDRFLAGLSGDRNYGAGDFGALKWSPNDSWLGRLGKAGAAFGIDTISDPLTWVSGVGGIGTKAGRIGAEAIPGAARETLDNLANRGFFADPAKPPVPTTPGGLGPATGPVKVAAQWGSPLADPTTVPAFQRQLEGPAAGTGTAPTAPVPPFVPPVTPAPLYKQPLTLPAGVGGKLTTPGSETVDAFTRTAEAVPATPVTEVPLRWDRSGGRLSQPPAPEPFGPTVQDRLFPDTTGTGWPDTDLAPANLSPGTEQLTVPFDGGISPERFPIVDRGVVKSLREDIAQQVEAVDRAGRTLPGNAARARSHHASLVNELRDPDAFFNETQLQEVNRLLNEETAKQGAINNAITGARTNPNWAGPSESELRQALADSAQAQDDLVNRMFDMDNPLSTELGTAHPEVRANVERNMREQASFVEKFEQEEADFSFGNHASQRALNKLEAEHQTALRGTGSVERPFTPPRQDPLFGKAGDGAAVNPRTGDRYAGTLRADAKAARNPGTFPETVAETAPSPAGIVDPLPFNLPARRPPSDVAAIPKSTDWEFYNDTPEPGDLARTGDGDPNWEFAGDREDPNWDFAESQDTPWRFIDREEPPVSGAGGDGTVPPETGGPATGAASAAPDNVAGANGKITREEFEENLKYGFEEEWVKRKSRGGRQGIEKVVKDYFKDKGLSDEEMQSIATEIFNALPDEARGGLGLRVPFLGRDADGKITSAGKSASRYLFTTPGGGRLIDRLGLGRAADAYYDTLFRLRRSRTYRKVADNLNGQDGKDWGDYLRGDITFKQFAKAREGREALRDSRAEYAEALATTKTLAFALAKKVGLSNTTLRAALKEYTGRGEKADLKHLTQEQRDAVEQIHKMTFTTMNEPWQEYKSYAADTRLHDFDPDLTDVDDYQPRTWTKKTEDHFQKYGSFQAGEQQGPTYNPKLKRASDVLKDEEKKTGRKLTNLEANELYKKQGLDVEFETDPLVMMDKYVNAIGYKISRLKQVKTLMDGGVIQRIVNADSKEMHAKGYVQLGGKAAEGRTISHEAGTNTWVKEELQEPVSRWLSSVKPGNSDLAKFAENVLKPAYAFFKTTATVGRGPGYHARNILGGVGNNWLGGITVRDHGLMTQMLHEESKARKTVAGLIRGDLRPEQVSAHLAEAYRKVQSRLRPGEVVTIQDAHDLVDAELEPTLSKIKVGGRAGNLHQERINMRKNRVGEDNILLQDLTEDQLRDAGLLSNDQNRFTLRPDLNPEDLSKTQKVFDKVLDNWWIRKNAGFARGSERWLRGSAYLGSARRFGSENEGLAAALNAKTIQYDYSDLSDFERKYLKGFAFPFYTFMRNNIPYQLQNLMKRPGYFTAIANAQQELSNQFVKRDDNGNIDEANSYLPQWTTEKEGFLTDTLVPKAFRRIFDPLNQSKDAPLISMIESPANDLNNYFKVGEGTHGIDLGALAGGLNPLLKEPVELWSGQDTFTGGTIQPTVLPGFLSGIGTGHDDDGNATINGKFAQTAKNFLPPLGVLQNLASVGTQGERAVSNRSGFFTGLPLATSTERQQTGELITRNHRATDMIDQYTNANNIDDEEKAFIRKLIAKGTQPDGTIPDTYRAYLDQVISQLKASPIAKK